MRLRNPQVARANRPSATPTDAMVPKSDTSLFLNRGVAGAAIGAALLGLLSGCTVVRNQPIEYITVTSTPPPTPPTAGSYEANTEFTEATRIGLNLVTNYHEGAGIVGQLTANQVTEVDCVLYDPKGSASGTDGLWYKLAEQRASNGLAEYAPAESFYNTPDYNQDSHNSYDPFVRFQVCPDSPEQVLPPPHSISSR